MRSLEHNIQSVITRLCNITASSQRQYYRAIQGLITINYTYGLPIWKSNGQRYRTTNSVLKTFVNTTSSQRKNILLRHKFTTTWCLCYGCYIHQFFIR